MVEYTGYIAPNQLTSLGEHFPLQKYISFLLSLYSMLHQHTSPLPSISGLLQR